MNVEKQLLMYLKDQIGDEESIIEYAKNNSLYYSIAHSLGIDVERQFYYKIN